MLHSLDKSHLNSVCIHYVCGKSENARVCTKSQWNALDWCYWIALTASPVMQSSNTVSCVSRSFCRHPCVLAIKSPTKLQLQQTCAEYYNFLDYDIRRVHESCISYSCKIGIERDMHLHYNPHYEYFGNKLYKMTELLNSMFKFLNLTISNHLTPRYVRITYS